MIVSKTYFQLMHREKLWGDYKMPEDLIKSEFAIFFWTKDILIIEDRIIIPDVKLV